MAVGLCNGRLPAELAAAVLALAGVRAGDVVLDLLPAAGLTAGLAAATGPGGSVLALCEPGEEAPLGATATIGAVTDLQAAQLRVGKVVLPAPAAAAPGLAELLVAVRGVLAPGARVTVAARPNGGALTEGLPAVLAACGLVVVHAEGLAVAGLPGGRVALAVGRPAGGS